MSEVEIPEDAPPPASRPRPRITLALSAFTLSLTMALIGAYYSLQGPEVLVRPPEQLLLFRDGEGANSVLGFELRLDMINGASNYGDVMLDAALEPAATGARFEFQSVMRPIFTGPGPAGDDCELGSRCLGFSGLKLIEQPDALVDLPGGSARAMHLSFAAASSTCTGDEKACARFADFDKAVSVLAARPLDVTIRMHFNRDGDRIIRCRGGKVDAAYIRSVGWQTLVCEHKSVSGEPWW